MAGLTPERLYQVSLELFARYGFRRTRVEDIAGELEVAAGTLYRYARSKRELYEKTVSFGIRRWQARVFDAIAGIGDAREQFLVMARAGFGYLEEDAALRSILIQDPQFFPLSPRKVRFPEIDTASVSLIRTILERGIRQGVFRALDTEAAAELLYSFYVMFIIKTYITSEGRTASQMFEHGLDLMLAGLLQRPEG